MSDFTPAITALSQASSLFITAHVGPDGDTLGTMLGLRHALCATRPALRVDCVISGKMPDVYRFMPGIETVKDCETATDLLERYDLAISVDCGSLDRLGPAGAHFSRAATSLNIDHHVSNEQFGQINLVVPQAAASGEVLFDLLQAMDVPVPPEAATCLYTAIVTDTGGFKYSNTSAKVMETVAALIRCGADPEFIFKQLYEEQPFEKLALHADAFLQTRFEADQRIAWTLVDQDLLKKHQALEEHVDGLVENLRRINCVLVAVVLKHTRPGETRVSCRSDDHRIDVSQVMQSFGGGGHKMAAGCTIAAPPREAWAQLLPRFREAVQPALAVT
ncbi:MAG: bifunctional oligoribonuclease/PAP phosphatase NrnA [Candidatus Melainabacteria bacterium]